MNELLFCPECARVDGSDGTHEIKPSKNGYIHCPNHGMFKVTDSIKVMDILFRNKIELEQAIIREWKRAYGNRPVSKK